MSVRWGVASSWGNEIAESPGPTRRDAGRVVAARSGRRGHETTARTRETYLKTQSRHVRGLVVLIHDDAWTRDLWRAGVGPEGLIKRSGRPRRQCSRRDEPDARQTGSVRVEARAYPKWCPSLGAHAASVAESARQGAGTHPCSPGHGPGKHAAGDSLTFVAQTKFPWQPNLDLPIKIKPRDDELTKIGRRSSAFSSTHANHIFINSTLLQRRSPK